MSNYNIPIRFEKKKKSKLILDKSKKNNYFVILLSILLLIIVGTIIGRLLFNYKSSYKINIQNDNVFSKAGLTSKNIYSLKFSIEDNYTLKSISIFDRIHLVSYSLDTSLYVTYNTKNYSLKNIINAIKQDRSESATSDFIYFLDDLVGLTISNYIYNFTSSNIYYTNLITSEWNTIIDEQNYTKEFLNYSTENLSDSSSIKIYDKDNNDIIIRKYNNNFRSVKIEIYNSTDINGYGTSVSRKLLNMGFGVVKVFNYDKAYPNTILYVQNDISKSIDLIKNTINLSIIKTDIPSDINSIADYILILGGDTLQVY